MLRMACSRWNLATFPDSFLGQGATGRVFKVGKGGETCALKIACGMDKARQLHRDYDAYIKLSYVR